jgi:hypothetical protein
VSRSSKDADSVASRHPPQIHPERVVITTINAITHAMSGFLCG